MQTTRSIQTARHALPGRRRFGKTQRAGGRWTAAMVVLLLSIAAGVSRPAPAIAQPAQNVALLAQVDEHAGYNDVWGYTSPGGVELAIIGTTSGTAFYDISDPADPQSVGFIDGPNSTWRDLKTRGRYCYIVTEGSSPPSERGMQVIDLDDPTQPVLVHTVQGGLQTAHNLYIDSITGRAYVAGTGAGLLIYDLASDPVQPPLLGAYTEHYVHDLFVQDGIAYLAAINDGLVILLDVSDAADPTELDRWTYPGAATHNTWTTGDGSVLVTTDEIEGGHVNVWDVSAPGGHPLLDDFWADPDVSAHNATISGALCYVAYYGVGLRILSIADPTAVEEVGYYDTSPGSSTFVGAWGVYPFTGIPGVVLVSDMTEGLFVLRYEPTFAVIEGTVLDAATLAPIGGATVEIMTLGASRTTNAAGYYWMQVEPGAHDVSVSGFGYAPTILPVDVGGGEVVVLDAWLDPLPTGGLAGTVREMSGAPLAGAEVTLDDTPLVAITDGAGAFAMTPVPIGVYEVVARRLGHANAGATVGIESGTATTVELTAATALYATDLEIDPGWSTSGDAVSGHWQWGDPIGTVGGLVQPEDDHTPTPGVACYVTGQGTPGGPPGENDVDGGSVFVATPTFDLSGLDDPMVQYVRWFTNDAGPHPGTDPWRVEISTDGGTIWIPFEQTQESAARWERQEFAIRDLLPEPISLAQTRVRFVAADLGLESIVEAAVDDIQLFDGGADRIGVANPEPTVEPGRRLTLLGNAPNPFNPNTTIRFELGQASPVVVQIYDPVGRRVHTLMQAWMQAGHHGVDWDGRSDAGHAVASGTYYYRVETDRTSERGSLTLMR